MAFAMDPALLRILQNVLRALVQRFAGGLLLRQHHRAAVGLQQPCVLLLVVGHHVGRGHQYGGHAQRRHLAEGAGSGAADDQIGGGHHHRHVIDVLPHIQQRTAETQPLQLAGHMGPVALSGGVDVVEGKAVRLLPPEEVQHPGVHGGRTQTAPEGGHQRLIVGIAQLFTGLLLRQSEEIAPHRRSRDHHLFGVLIVAAAVLEPHHHAVHAALQQLGGQARGSCWTRGRRWEYAAGRRP